MTTTDAQRDIASTVRAEVARKRVKQQDIATALGLSQRAVSRRLLGQVEWSALQLVDLAALLELEPAALLSGPTVLANTS